MKLLFVHDHPFYKGADNVVYTGGSFPKELWNNYLINFQYIDVFARDSKSPNSKNGISSTKNVSFYLTKNYSSATDVIKNYPKIKQELKILCNTPLILGQRFS